MSIYSKELEVLEEYSAILENNQKYESEPLLLTIEQHLENFEDRDIKFEKISHEEANDFLTNNTYLFKISLYKNSFFMTKERKFLDLDFGYLIDLSTMDMHLRYTFLKICLDIEHGIKTRILAYFNKKNPNDGYSIVDRYIQSKFDKGRYSTIKCIKLNLLNYAKYNNHHLNYLYRRVKTNNEKDKSTKINIWELVECISVNELINFYIFYRKSEIEKRENTSLKSLLYSYRHIRNISAHNSPFFIDCNKTIKKNALLIEHLKGKVSIKVNLSNRRVSDICSLFYLHKYFVNSEGIISNRRTELGELINRLFRNYDYYEKSYVKIILDATDELVDIFYN